MQPRYGSATARALAKGYRSGLEDVLASQLERAGLPVRFEVLRVAYQIPSRTAKYTPDFLLPNGIIIEGKGKFESDDRQKHKLVKAQHPDLDIRFVFSRSKSPIRKGSPTTYAMWCEQYGFQFTDKVIPQAWLDEPVDAARLKAAQEWLKA